MPTNKKPNFNLLVLLYQTCTQNSIYSECKHYILFNPKCDPICMPKKPLN